MVLVERYSNDNQDEIMLELPLRKSYILSTKIDSDHYQVCVVVQWYGQKFFPTHIDSVVIDDKVSSEYWKSIFNGPTSDLIAIIRESLPVIKDLNIQAGLEM